MLAGVPVERVISEARACFGVPEGLWPSSWQLVRAWAGTWHADTWIFRRFLGSDVEAAYLARIQKFARDWEPIELSALPEGRGLLQIFGPRSGHCVAYADGLVFDPELPEPLGFSEWRSLPLIRDWRIGAVLPVVHPNA